MQYPCLKKNQPRKTGADHNICKVIILQIARDRNDH